MGILGSKRAIDAACKNTVITEEEKQFINDNFEKTICAANGTYCIKGCTYDKGTECQRLLNKKNINNG